MGFRPSTAKANDDTHTQLVDQQLGEAYANVKLVSDNIAIIQALGAQSAGLALIAASITQLEFLVTQIDNLTTISGEIADLEPLLTNINALVALHAGMADLLELHGDLTALQTLYTNMSVIIDELVAVAAITTELTAVAGNTANINIVAGMEAAIAAIPALVADAQQAAIDAAAAAASLNLPIAGPGDGGKYLAVDPDTFDYVLLVPPVRMDPATYDPDEIAANVYSVDNHVAGTTNKLFTAANQTKLSGIETAADVTDAGNVGSSIAGVAAKTTLVDADAIGGINSVGNVLTKWTWANIKAGLKAAAADVYASVADKFLTTDMIASASTYVALPNSATPTINWDSGINREITIEQNTELQNPLNGRPGTYRTLLVKGNSATPRSFLFDDQFKGEVPEIDDVNDTKWYDITIKCITSVHYTATAQVARSV
jgi:hypothetical protein